MSKDQIHIRDLLLRTIIGIRDEERLNRQDVLINLTLYTDHAAAASDHIEDTVDYSALTKQVVALVEGSQFFLVEKLALEIAKLGLADSRVTRIIVTVDKPGAVRFTRSVGVTVDRTRQEMRGA